MAQRQIWNILMLQSDVVMWAQSRRYYRLLLFSHSVMYDSLRPRRLQPTRLLCPWDSPGKNAGVGCRLPINCPKRKKSLGSLQASLNPLTWKYPWYQTTSSKLSASQYSLYCIIKIHIVSEWFQISPIV